MACEGIRIALDLCPFSDTRSGGTAHFALSVVREFSKILPDRLVVFCLLSGKKLAHSIQGVDKNNVITLDHGWHIHRHRSRFDVLFTPYYLPTSSLPDSPVVNFIPDIQQEYFPQYFSSAILRHRRLWYAHSAHSVTTVITPSHYSKETMCEKIGVAEEKIRVVYLGFHPIFADDSNHGTRPAGLPEGMKDYLFYPANAWFHKNHIKLLDALVILRNQGKSVPTCVFTGHLETAIQGYVDLPHEIRIRGLSDHVMHLGQVPLQELKYLYGKAAALVHPSLFEGFGIPLLEAMATKCPIVASDRTSIPEIAGEAALYFDPDNPQDIAEKLLILFDYPEETEKRKCLGKQRSKHFSDEKMAQEILEVLDEAYLTHGREPLRKRAASFLPYSSQPLLTLIILASSALKPSAVDHVKSLARACGKELEVIAVAPTDCAPALKESMPRGTRILTGSQPLNSTFLEAALQGTGTFVYVSEGNALPLEYVINYLIINQVQLEEKNTDILYGNTYFCDKDLDQRWCLDLPTDHSVDEKETACQNLAMIIRRESFIEGLSQSVIEFNSLPEVAHKLWDICSRRNIYRAVNVIYGVRASNSVYYAKMFEKLLRQYFSSQSFLSQTCRTRTFALGARLVGSGYGLMPEQARASMLGWVKKAGKLRSSFLKR